MADCLRGLRKFGNTSRKYSRPRSEFSADLRNQCIRFSGSSDSRRDTVGIHSGRIANLPFILLVLPQLPLIVGGLTECGSAVKLASASFQLSPLLMLTTRISLSPMESWRVERPTFLP